MMSAYVSMLADKLGLRCSSIVDTLQLRYVERLHIERQWWLAREKLVIVTWSQFRSSP